VTDANLRQVKPDMNPKEVESILGLPQRVRTFDMELQTQRKTLDATEFHYEQDGRTVVVHFVGNKMVKVNGSFDQ
jgi:outer membrane protein assembly factor BamE (lipoprotein component of BamABCDE complex)